MDPFGRAKTVRIGKWRWPPARSDGEPVNNVTGSFLEFKMHKQMKKVKAASILFNRVCFMLGSRALEFLLMLDNELVDYNK